MSMPKTKKAEVKKAVKKVTTPRKKAVKTASGALSQPIGATVLGKDILVRTLNEHFYAAYRAKGDEYNVPEGESTAQFLHLLNTAFITVVEDKDMEYLKKEGILKA